MRHRETTVFSCGPQTGKGFILEITLRFAEGLCKIKGNFLLIHTKAIFIQTWQTSACLILRSSVGYGEKGCSVDILFFVEQFQLKVFLKTFFRETFLHILLSVCVWCKLWEYTSISNDIAHYSITKTFTMKENIYWTS